MTFTQRVVSITQDKIIPKIFDNILSDNVMSFRLVSNGKKWVGETLKIPVKLVKSTLGGSFSGLDTHSTDTDEPRRTMSYNLRAYEMPVAIAGLDKLVNASEAKVIDLMKASTESAGMDALDDIAEILYGDGSGNAGKDFNGLDNLVDDGTVADLIGTLSRTTWPTLAGTRTDSGGTVSLAKLQTLYTAVSGGSASRQKPTLIDSGEAERDYYESLLTATQRAVYDTQGYPVVTRRSRGPIKAAEFKGGAGFTSLIYKGVPWVADEQATSGTIFMLNERYLNWYGAKDPSMSQVSYKGTHDGVYSEAPSNFSGLQFSGFMKPINQYGTVGHIYLFGELTTPAPRRQGQLYDVAGV